MYQNSATPNSAPTTVLSFNKFPVEIIDHIISHLRTRPQTLSACASASRAWRTLCLTHLFSSIHVRGRRVDAFADFMAASPSIAKHVRSLSIGGQPPSGSAPSPYAPIPSLVASHENAIVRILSCLTSLKVLLCSSIWFLHPEDRPPFITQSLCGRFKLRRLTLERCWAGSRQQVSSFATILAMFDADRLEVLEARFPPRSGLEPLHVPTPRTLTCRNLRLQPLQDPAGYSLTLEAFRHTLSAECLRTLSVDCWNWEHVRGIGALLRDCCSHLEHLRMDAFPMALADGG